MNIYFFQFLILSSQLNCLNPGKLRYLRQTDFYGLLIKTRLRKPRKLDSAPPGGVSPHPVSIAKYSAHMREVSRKIKNHLRDFPEEQANVTNA